MAIVKFERRKKAREEGRAKSNRRMGRALAARRWHGGEIVPERAAKTAEFTITTRPNGDVIIPLYRAGAAVPAEDEVITELVMGLISK